ncbi:MAG: amidase family protein [Bacillota bacterium]
MDLAFLDATAQAALVQRGELGPGDLVAAAAARVLRLNPSLNAVTRSLFEGDPEVRVQRTAAPFCGVPALVDPPFRAGEGPFAPGLGLVVAGIANLTDPAVSDAREAARNPWDISRTPGTGSGGAAAAVAAGLVPVAYGRAVLAPSASCGVLGFQGTGEPAGLIARSVRDGGARRSATTAGAVRGLRIRLVLQPEGLHPDCLDAVNDAATLCAAIGHQVTAPAEDPSGCDLWLAPGLHEPPPPLELSPWSRPPSTVAAGPALAVPLFWNPRGLPVGVLFSGPPGAEALLLRLAAQLESARPWAHRRPPVHA